MGVYGSKWCGLPRAYWRFDEIYSNILKENLASNAKKLSLDRTWIFQQDNDPKQTSQRMVVVPHIETHVGAFIYASRSQSFSSKYTCFIRKT